LRMHKRRNIFREEWKLNYTNTCEQLRDEFRNDMKKVFNRKCTKLHNDLDLKANGVKHILIKLRLLGKNSHNWFIPKELFYSNNKIKRAWLRAFFDDEATIDIQKKVIRLKIVNKNGLIQIQQLLLELGINSNITGPNCDNTWFLNIRHENIFKFNNLIGFNHPKQKEKLKELIKHCLLNSIINS